MPQPLVGDRENAAAAAKRKQIRIPHPLASSLNEQQSSFAIEYRVQDNNKKKFRPFLGADVDDPRRFVSFVLEASGCLETAPKYSLLLSLSNFFAFSCPRECHLRMGA